MSYLVALLFLAGHGALAVAVINRLHSTGIPRPWLKVCDLCWFGYLLGVPLAAGWYWRVVSLGGRGPLRALVVAYIALCCVAILVAAVHRVLYLARGQATAQQLSNHTQSLAIDQRLGHRPAATLGTRWLSYLPGNEVFDLQLHTKTLQLPRLDRRLDQLTIAHLSDLHMTGHLTRSFYDEIVDQANGLHADLIAITGDIVEKPKCLSWIAGTLGRLRAPLGVYYILGNHELRIKDRTLIRKILDEAGLVGVGGRWVPLVIRGAPLVVAGNELPWHPPAPDMHALRAAVGRTRPFSLLLAHSPDQLPWARRHDFDLVLAGHTHGGQVRLPLIGPILAPCATGIRHAAGIFYRPPTLMHVSRGVAATRAVRFGCPPELTCLVLRSS
jgi:hypothetical protein